MLVVALFVSSKLCLDVRLTCCIFGCTEVYLAEMGRRLAALCRLPIGSPLASGDSPSTIGTEWVSAEVGDAVATTMTDVLSRIPDPVLVDGHADQGNERMSLNSVLGFSTGICDQSEVFCVLF